MAENSQQESTSKLHLPLDVKVYESGENNAQLLEEDELPVGEVKCKLEINEHKTWQDGLADGEEDYTFAQNCLVVGSSAMEMSEIFLPELPILRILDYLSFADLKSMRSVCFDANTNSVISSSLNKRGCLALHPNTKNLPVGSELEGWSSLRLRDFLQSVDYSVDDDGRWPAVWDDCLGVDYFKKNAKHLLQVTYLDLKNSFVHHVTVLDLLHYFQNLETFQFVFNLTGYKKCIEPNFCSDVVVAAIENTMSKFEDIIEQEVKAQLWKDKYQSSSYPPISSIRNIRISVPSMIIANAMIRVLEYRCDRLESFKLEADIYRMMYTMRNEADYYNAIRVSPDLFLKNKSTLKKFEFLFTSKFQFGIDQAPESMSYRCLAAITVEKFLQIRGLHLEEFTLSIPLSIRADIQLEGGVYVLDMLKNFLINQAGSLKLIRILQLEWHKGTESFFERNAFGDAKVELDIALNFTCEAVPKWNKIQDFIKGLTVLPDAAQFKNISSLFPNSDPLPKVRSYSLETSKDTEYGFEGWQMPYVVEKFPNLTELTIWSHSRLVNDNCMQCWQRKFETYRPRTYFGDFQVHDKMLQLILEKLPKLQVLDLDLYMANLTDFGITGVSLDAQERMKSENAYITKPGDKIGFSLPMGLKSVSLIGIAGLVTNASVYLTLRKLAKLKKLVMSSPKFTKNGMKVLKDAFEGRQDFELRIYKTGELERERYTCKCRR